MKNIFSLESGEAPSIVTQIDMKVNVDADLDKLQTEVFDRYVFEFHVVSENIDFQKYN